MLVDGSRFKELYDAVNQEQHQSEDKSILMFVANSDVDAICAVRQLQDILRTDETPFSQNPVGSYEEIAEACASISDTQELRTVFCINCGATTNLRARCGIEDNPNIRLVIIDSHRPIWHGYNNGDESTLVLVDGDDPVPVSQTPVWEDLDDELRQSEELYLRRLSAEQAGASDEEDEQYSPGGGEGGPKRRKVTMPPGAKQKREQMISYYSEKAGFGKPSSMLLYDLVHKLHLERMFSLWLAILGLTDQLVHQRINRDDYDAWRKVLEQHLRLQQQQQGAAAQGAALQQQRHDSLTIARITDLRLTVLRQWTLREALKFSTYTAARLHAWTDKGMANVNLLVAKMGILSQHADAPYPNMDRRFREMLPRQLEAEGAAFGIKMDSLKVEGFELLYKSDIRISATDMVLLMTMMLGRSHADATEAKMGFHEVAAIVDVERNRPELGKSYEHVKRILQSIVTQGGQAMHRRDVKGNVRGSKFWFLDASGADFASKQDFHHPATLQHLALFLREAMCRRTGTHKAMVVVGPPDNDGCCYVVALRAKETAGVMQNNPFARPFVEVVDSMGIRPQRTTFDNTLYFIRKDQATDFLEELKGVISKYDADAQIAAAVAAA